MTHTITDEGTKLPHSWDEGVVTVEPSEDNGGERLYTCTEQRTVSAEGGSFTDVMPDSFYYQSVMWALENGITAGVSATKFGVSGICNRAQVVTFLYRAFA